MTTLIRQSIPGQLKYAVTVLIMIVLAGMKYAIHVQQATHVGLMQAVLILVTVITLVNA